MCIIMVKCASGLPKLLQVKTVSEKILSVWLAAKF